MTTNQPVTNDMAIDSEELAPDSIVAAPANTTTPDSARRRAFEQAVREHLQHPPTEWTVKRITARQWYVVDHRDARIAVRTTKKAAHAAIDDSTERRIWDENCAWYRGESTDPRTRQLTTEEKAIVAAVLVEIAGSGGADGG